MKKLVSVILVLCLFVEISFSMSDETRKEKTANVFWFGVAATWAGIGISIGTPYALVTAAYAGLKAVKHLAVAVYKEEKIVEAGEGYASLSTISGTANE